MTEPVTDTMLRDLVVCERRVHHDLHTASAERDPVSDFVAMLRDGGILHEDRIVEALPGARVDLRDRPVGARFALTMSALEGYADWIVGGRLEHGDRVGHPDLLRRIGGVWHAGDVKAGTPFAEDGGTAKEEYAVQVGHYAALLGDLGRGEPARAFIVGADGSTAWYDLDAPGRRGAAPWSVRVAALVARARGVRDLADGTRGALSAACAMCHWKTVCRRELEAADDLTLVAGLGRAVRISIEARAGTVAELAALDMEGDPDLRRGLPGVGAGRLGRFRDRARLLRTPGARPYALRPLGLARHARELHFDLETDPLNGGLVYLHGILVRDLVPGGDVERFVHFFADGPDGERNAFAGAFAFLSANASARVFHYSKFERTSYRVLQERYPDVCSREEVEALFDPARATDLLGDAVMPSTEWPLSSVGIKAIAKFLGFSWRDRDASGAASIAWFHDYCRSRDPAVRQRILDYNEDDCRATAVLLDALIALPVGAPQWPAPAAVDAAGGL